MYKEVPYALHPVYPIDRILHNCSTQYHICSICIKQSKAGDWFYKLKDFTWTPVLNSNKLGCFITLCLLVCFRTKTDLEIDIDTVHRTYLDFLSLTCTYLCVRDLF